MPKSAIGNNSGNWVKDVNEKGHKQINKKLGIIHLDVEGYESKVISGGVNTILKDKPYLSLEDHDNNIDEFIKLLGNKYVFNKRIHSNNTFIYK